MGVAAAPSKFQPRLGHKRHAPLNWHIGSQKVCIVGLVRSSSKFYPWVARKRYAPLEWHLPSLNFTLGWLTKGMRRGNGTRPIYQRREECASRMKLPFV